MSTNRPPLSTARRENVPIKAAESAKDADHKLKKALAGLAEERRKRAEVEGVVQGLKREKECSSSEKDRMNRELAFTQAEIKAQKTTIMRLSATAAASSASSTTHAEFEAKLQDLVAKHNSSKAKHQAELEDAKTSNRSLQSLISALQSSSTTDRQTITDLRSERALLKKELDLIRTRPPPARDDRADDLSRFKDERKAWREEKIALEAQVRELRKVVGDAEGLGSRVSELEERNGGLQCLLADSARACEAVCRDSVDRREYLKLEEELVLERSARATIQRKWRESRGMCRMLERENSSVQERIGELMAERDGLAADLKDLIRQRRADRIHPHPRHSSSSLTPVEPPIDLTSPDAIALLDLALSHIDLVSSHTSSLIASHQSTISSLSADLDHARSSLSTARSSLSTLQSTHSATSSELEAMLAAHSDCGAQIMDWRAEASRASAQEARLKSELCDVRRTLEHLEETTKGEREMLRRANEGSARWGAARVALEDEVQSLRLALEDYRGLQQRYDAIEEEVEILRSREAMASEEAERLGVQNAELIGHGNGGQKISYVEGLRREMALVKHELATTRHHLNAASAQILDLTAEVEAYKSIAPPSLGSVNATGRVRVARRQPEGGEVLGASFARRSVSTSGGGMRRY